MCHFAGLQLYICICHVIDIYIVIFVHVSWIYVCIPSYICIYVYLGRISSLMQISLNIIDILCLHIFFWIYSNSRITFIVFGGNWFRYCPSLYVSLVLQILEALYIRNLQPALNRIQTSANVLNRIQTSANVLNRIQTSANVLKCL